MTSNNGTQRNRPKLSTVLANAVATVATLSSYIAMVNFATHVLEMSPIYAYATAGVFEMMLFTVAVLARERAKDGKPYGMFMLLTIVFATAAGCFAGWEEIYVGHPWGAAVFRLMVAWSAAAAWHFEFLGLKELSTGISWRAARINRRMQTVQEATEALFRARDLGKTSVIKKREKAYIRAVSRARHLVTPDEMRALTEAQQDSADALVSHLAFTRSGHERINAAFEGRGVQVPRVERRATVRTVTPNAPTVPTVALADNATEDAPVATVAASAETPRTAVTASVDEYDRPTGPGTLCHGCGRPNRGGKTPRAKFCQVNEYGEASTKCRQLYNDGKGYYPKPSTKPEPVAAFA